MRSIGGSFQLPTFRSPFRAPDPPKVLGRPRKDLDELDVWLVRVQRPSARIAVAQLRRSWSRSSSSHSAPFVSRFLNEKASNPFTPDPYRISRPHACGCTTVNGSRTPVISIPLRLATMPKAAILAHSLLAMMPMRHRSPHRMRLQEYAPTLSPQTPISVRPTHCRSHHRPRVSAPQPGFAHPLSARKGIGRSRCKHIGRCRLLDISLKLFIAPDATLDLILRRAHPHFAPVHDSLDG